MEQNKITLDEVIAKGKFYFAGAGGGSPSLVKVVGEDSPSAKALAGAGEQAPGRGGVVASEVARMNVFDRLSAWWEKRRVVRKPEFELLAHNIHKILQEDRKTSVAADVVALKLRMDRLELFVGLKREPQATVIPGSARIK